LVIEEPSIFYVITLIVGGVGFEKIRFEFECLGILIPVLLRVVRSIYPGTQSYIMMQGTQRVGSSHVPQDSI